MKKKYTTRKDQQILIIDKQISTHQEILIIDIDTYIST